jgi:hydrogenase maturation protease
MAEILVLGLGNILMSDDGVGVKVVERLREKYKFPERVGVLDGGIRGLALMPCLEGIRKLIVVDAVASFKTPGDLTRLAGEEVLESQTQKVFSHQGGLADLLLAARFTKLYPEEVILWGVEPAVVTPGMGLSPPIAARVDDLVEKIMEELRRWDIEPRPNENKP